MRVRNLFLIVMLATFLGGLSSCSKEARLSGTIATEDGAQVLLLSADNPNDDPVDSAVVMNGTFEFRGEGYADGLYFILLPDQANFLTFVGEQPVQMALSLEPGVPTTVTGGKYAAQFSEYYAARGAFEVVVSECRTQLMPLQADTTAEGKALRQEVESRWISAGEEYTDKMYKLAAANPNSHLSLYLYRSILMDGASERLAAIKSELEQWDGTLSEHPNMVFIMRQIALEEAIAVGRPFVDFTAETADGVEAMLSDVAGKGKIVLVEFWASWCRFCRLANPDLVKIYQEYSGKGFDIFGLSLDRDRAEWEQAVKDDALPWQQYIVREGVESPADLYNVRGIPFNVLLDAEGNILAKGLTPDDLRTRLAELL